MFIFGLYLAKGYRRVAPWLFSGGHRQRAAYRAILDQLSDIGGHRRFGETREAHAARLAPISPHFAELTACHLAQALGGKHQQKRGVTPEFARSLAAVRSELRTHVRWSRRFLGALNPTAWLWTR